MNAIRAILKGDRKLRIAVKKNKEKMMEIETKMKTIDNKIINHGDSKMINIDELRELGFERAANEIKEQMPVLRKVVLAKEHFRFVTPENLKRAREEMKAATKKVTRVDFGSYTSETYCDLAFTAVQDYKGVPPTSVLESLRKARKVGCFDSFSVCTLERITEKRDFLKPVADPILFGQINGSGLLFFIDQWGDDIRIESIIRPDEG